MVYSTCRRCVRVLVRIRRPQSGQVQSTVCMDTVFLCAMGHYLLPQHCKKPVYEEVNAIVVF